LGIGAHHHLRDATFAEDASQLRTGTAPGRGLPAQPWPSASCEPTLIATSPLRSYARAAIRIPPTLGTTSPRTTHSGTVATPWPARRHQPARHRTAGVQGVLAGTARCFRPGCQRRDRDRAFRRRARRPLRAS
jgi:hypothetical protein